jgi:hypothetical protein
MIWELSGAPAKSKDGLYLEQVQAAAENTGFPPQILYCIAEQETIDGERNKEWNAATVVSGDGGHGLCQLTSSYPANWADPEANAEYAVEGDPMFLRGAFKYWYRRGYRQRSLVKLAAATYNAGLGNVLRGHQNGNADEYDTDNYGQRLVDRLDALGYFG